MKIGDIVRLKSGGPRMTIENIIEPTISDTLYSYAECVGPVTYVVCIWFKDSNLKSTAKLDIKTLLKA